MSASAKSTKNPCTIENRLGVFMLTRCWQDYNLFVGGNVHAKACLRRDSKPLARRCLAQLALESCTLALQGISLGIELRQASRLLDADRPAPDDCQRDDDKCSE